jgi:hypothetical protein
VLGDLFRVLPILAFEIYTNISSYSLKEITNFHVRKKSVLKDVSIP